MIGKEVTDFLMCFTKLTAMTLIEDKYHLLAVDGQVTFTLHQVVELLNSGDDDLVITSIQIALEAGRAVGAIHTIRRKALVLLHGLVVEVFTVDHKEYLVDKIELSGQAGGFEAG